MRIAVKPFLTKYGDLTVIIETTAVRRLGDIYTTVKIVRLSVTVGVAGWAWSLHGKQT